MRVRSQKTAINTLVKNQHAGGLPRLPNERDEAPDGQAGAPRKVTKQAYLDLQHGLVDTDLHDMGEIGNTRASAPEPYRKKIKKTQPQ